MPAIPEWVGTAVIGAVFAVGGYFGRALLDSRKARRRARERVDTQLHELATLLDESRSLFVDQNIKARRLLSQLQQRLGDAVPAGLGFDETFYRLYDQLNGEERELHGLIRSSTLNSIKRVNTELSAWLDNHGMIRRMAKQDPLYARLAAQLDQLGLHLNQWLDKFAFWMGDERRTLVYLADEKRQGSGFPAGLQPALDAVLSRTAPPR